MNQAALRVYPMVSRFGFDEETEVAATTGIYLPALTGLPGDLKYIPATAYEKHRDEIEDIVDSAFEPAYLECKVAKALAEPRMRTKLVRITCRGCERPACIEELGIVCKATWQIACVKSSS